MIRRWMQQSAHQLMRRTSLSPVTVVYRDGHDHSHHHKDRKKKEHGHDRSFFESFNRRLLTQTAMIFSAVAIDVTPSDDRKTSILKAPKPSFSSKGDDVKRNKRSFNPMFMMADIVEETMPAVVYIQVRSIHPVFGHEIRTSGGTGFFISTDGYVLSNAHVVSSNDVVEVRMMDGSWRQGMVHAVDERIDLALIKVTPVKEGEKFPLIPLGSSRLCRAGEWVVALGSPFALTNSITAGIISAVKRESQELGLTGFATHFIQTDAAINQGNSGGPLVDMEGHCIGINAMKVGEGIAFAIPTDTAKEFLLKVEDYKLQLNQRKKVTEQIPRHQPSTGVESSPRRFIGLTMLTINDEMAQHLETSNPMFPPGVRQGILVMMVVVGSPAHQSGLLPSDVITHVDQVPCINQKVLFDALSVGGKSKLNLTINRQGKEMQLQVSPR